MVVLVHGDGPPEILAGAKDWGVFQSLGRIVAAAGLAAVTFTHGSSMGLTRLRDAAEDVDALIDHVRGEHADLSIDPDRLALWVFSMGPPVGLHRALLEPAPFLRCLAVYYGMMSLLPLRADTPPEVSDEELAEFSPLELFRRSSGGLPPTLIARAGLEERPWLNPTIDDFVAEPFAATWTSTC